MRLVVLGASAPALLTTLIAPGPSNFINPRSASSVSVQQQPAATGSHWMPYQRLIAPEFMLAAASSHGWSAIAPSFHGPQTAKTDPMSSDALKVWQAWSGKTEIKKFCYLPEPMLDQFFRGIYGRSNDRVWAFYRLYEQVDDKLAVQILDALRASEYGAVIRQYGEMYLLNGELALFVADGTRFAAFGDAVQSLIKASGLGGPKRDYFKPGQLPPKGLVEALASPNQFPTRYLEVVIESEFGSAGSLRCSMQSSIGGSTDRSAQPERRAI